MGTTPKEELGVTRYKGGQPKFQKRGKQMNKTVRIGACSSRRSANLLCGTWERGKSGPGKTLNTRVIKGKLFIYMFSLFSSEKLSCFQSFALFFDLVSNVLEFSTVLDQGHQTLPKVTSSVISANVFKLIKESQCLSESGFNSFLLL